MNLSASILKCCILPALAMCLMGVNAASAQNGYVSPFPSGYAAPNVAVAPGYGYASPYAGGGGYGYGGGGFAPQVSPYGGGVSGYAQPGYNQGGGVAQSVTGSAPAAMPAPIAGAQQNNSNASTGPNAAASSGASPSAAARGSLREGDVLHGRASAVTGGSLSVEGVTLNLVGTVAPAVSAICPSSGPTVWRCGEHARSILSQILAKGPVQCTFSVSAGMPSGRCTIGFDDVSQSAVQEGAAMASDVTYLGYNNQARADRRGIWARAGR